MACGDLVSSRSLELPFVDVAPLAHIKMSQGKVNAHSAPASGPPWDWAHSHWLNAFAKPDLWRLGPMFGDMWPCL